MRLPCVMVPVLSRMIVLISPAASTDFPDFAITLYCVTLSIPAIPIAESRPPIVVGIKHTSNAIKVAIGNVTLIYEAIGTSVVHTSKR